MRIAHHFSDGETGPLGNLKARFSAQYAAVKADNASPIPGNLSIEQAAVLPTDALTRKTDIAASAHTAIRRDDKRDMAALLFWGRNSESGVYSHRAPATLGANGLQVLPPLNENVAGQFPI